MTRRKKLGGRSAENGRGATHPAILHRVTAALVGLTLALQTTGPVAGEEYLLGPQDRLRLKIYEWRASRDVIFEWTALNDVFTIGADGSLSLPFVGSVPAEGLPPVALAGIIAQRLVHQMRLGQAPDVAVEIVEFRPFYVAGHVAEPGEFPYRPRLTVLQALSIAGGLRTREETLARVEREVIASRGEVSLLSLSHISLLVRRARLQAELDERDDVAFPATLTAAAADGTADILMQQERAVFAARRLGLTTQLRALTELHGFLLREAESLGNQLGFLDQQIESVREELATVTTLVEQGLAVAPRQLALERTLLQVQGDRLAAETALLRARQESSRTEISILELKNTRASEVANELREVEVQLSETVRRTDTALLLLHDSEITAPRLLALRDTADRAQPVYTIHRRGVDGDVEIAATETTAVEPGDTVKVEIPLPSRLDLEGLPPSSGVPPADLLSRPAGGQAILR